MAATLYSYPPKPVNGDLLTQEIVAAGLPPPEEIYAGGDGSVNLVFDPALTDPQESALAGVVAAHAPPGPRRKRTVYAIYQQVSALTAAQKTAVWNNLQAGSPPRWATDAGPNAAAIAAVHWSAANSGATTANLNDARARLAALYAQDNPAYLVTPAFDPSVNVPGDEPGV